MQATPDPKAELLKAAEEVRAHEALDPVTALLFTEPIEQRTRRAVVRLELDGDLQESADLHSLFGDLLVTVATKLDPEQGALFLEMSKTWKLAAEGIAGAAQYAEAATAKDAPAWPDPPAPRPTVVSRAPATLEPNWGRTLPPSTNPARARDKADVGPSTRTRSNRDPGPGHIKR